MSKIYKALEKAERERESGSRRDVPPMIARNEVRAWEKPKKSFVLRPRGRVFSGQQLVSFYQPKSLGAEQFRKLRTHLLQLNAQNPPRTIMVTSATSGEGKTFVAVNLAAGIATDFQAHALLVECDLRAPTLANWFGVLSRRGLSDYLTGDEKISRLLINTEVRKLSVLPGGSVQENSAELIGSKKMEELAHELKSRYRDRYIIFDSTPLLATSEPEVLSKLVDGIIVVVKAGVTPRETVKQAIASLEKEKILGFVLNDLTFKCSGLFSRYFGSDGYYYKYGYDKKNVKRQKRRRLLF